MSLSMEQQFITQLLSGLAATGLPSLLMGAAIWWLQKSNSGWIITLNQEREARLKDHDERIQDLQKRSDSCEADRVDLRQKLFSIIAEVHSRKSQ